MFVEIAAKIVEQLSRAAKLGDSFAPRGCG